MKVVVIGGSGAIGFPAVRALVSGGHEVRATARGADKQARLREAGAEPIDVDVYDLSQLRDAVRGCDAVVRLTTKIPPTFAAMRSRKNWEETNRLRTLSASLVAQAAQVEGVGTYVGESFFGVYGDAGDRWVDEDSATDPGGFEPMRAALEGEDEVREFAKSGARGVVLRFAGFYGPGAGSSRVTLAYARRRMLPIVGSGENFWSSVHLEDAGAAVAAAVTLPSGVYNVSDDEPLRWREYLSTAAAAVDGPAPLRLPGFLGPLVMGYPWKWMQRSLRLSNARLKAASSWRPQYTSVRTGWPSVAREIASAG